MKYIRLLLLMILLLPVMVFAKDECDNSKIQIKSIEVSDKTNLVEELSPPTADGLKLSIDVSLSKLGDSITYKMEVENSSNSDYLIKEEDIVSNSEYINYDFTYSDDSNVIKGKSSKDVYLRVSYDTEVPSDKLDNGILKEEKNVTVALLSEKRKDNILKNPETGTIFFLSFVIIMNILFLIITKKKKVIIPILLFSLLFIPVLTKAVCSLSIDMNSKVTIDTRSATFKPGIDVNIQMKKLANPETSNITWTTSDTKITSIKRSNQKPENLTDENIVSIPESENPIYMWFDIDTIYFYSDAKVLYLNESGEFMFSYFKGLIDLSGLSNFDSSRCTSLQGLFRSSSALENLDSILNWDVSNVTNLYGFCWDCTSLENVDGLTNWNTMNIKTIFFAFYRCENLKNVDGLSNWDVSNVTNITNLFAYCSNLESINGLSGWNVSNVTNFGGLFTACGGLNSIDALSNWDVSNGASFLMCFAGCLSLINLDALSNWDVSNATNMVYMFEDCNSLVDASGINNWDINNVTSFTSMFSDHTSGEFILNQVHPEFTKRPGTWSDDGTFVPNN